MNGGKAGMGLDSSRLMEGTLRPAGLQRKLEKKKPLVCNEQITSD
jgi:hypothetical protein